MATSASKRRGQYRIRVFRSWPEAAQAAAQFAGAIQYSPFQSTQWLAAWYPTLGTRAGVEPLIVVAEHAVSGEPAVLLPLLLVTHGRAAHISFADLGITDYNAPWLGPGAPTNAAGAVSLWRAIRAALPAAQYAEFIKMPSQIAGSDNPLGQLRGAVVDGLTSNVTTIDGSWEDYRRGLVRAQRMDIERSLRVYERRARNPRLVIAADVETAMGILDWIEATQRQRIAQLNLDYGLDSLEARRFYRQLITDGLASGYTVIAALMDGDADIVSAAYSLNHGGSLAVLRIAYDAQWSNCAPGRLIVDRTMYAFFERGLRRFDFTTGDYDYKRALGARQSPLLSIRLPLSLTGRIKLGRTAFARRVGDQLLRYPRVRAGVKKALDKAMRRRHDD